MHTCTTCMESHPSIPTHPSLNGHIWNRFHREIDGHRFSKWNNMDHGDKPIVLSIFKLNKISFLVLSRFCRLGMLMVENIVVTLLITPNKLFKLQISFHATFQTIDFRKLFVTPRFLPHWHLNNMM